MNPHETVLVMRLAAPMQSWGGNTPLNRRDTQPAPTKSGVLGLLAAAAGRRRGEPITELLDLTLGVRVDQPGTLLRDYHTVSNYTGDPLPQAGVNAKGRQKPTQPVKHTGETYRFYLADAVFVAAVCGPASLLDSLAVALRNPRFPLALGRRSCPPTGQLLLGIEAGTLDEVLASTPWQAGSHAQNRYRRRHPDAAVITLPGTVEDPEASGGSVWDVPTTFSLGQRRFTPRRVRHTEFDVPTGWAAQSQPPPVETAVHDPFDLLG
ncbi:type I-E CRISPR-associated protein Cas5/CasD [Catenulispora pinisilvae]|uniref:type I-E CRISPR-associated protein Cas5/CasD n=1 Tax=Catenulispora pinisilvae TaxID=2705253 RepID=UPI002B27080B|nr:type I-E CRISPR-associated protein Cas5/CasD [Catenulispora pinisilvae]